MAKNLSIDNVVKVNISRESAAPETVSFDSFLYIGVNADAQNPKIPQAERVREFSGAPEVGQVFGTSSDIYKGSLAWFGQDPQPSSLMIGLRYGGTDAPPVGGAKALGNPAPFNQDTWRSVTNGSFSFTYNGVLVTINNLDFNAINTGHDVASVINSAFNNLTPENPNVTISATASAIYGVNVWTDANGEPYKDLDGNFWLTHIAPTGELICGWDEYNNTFYFVTTAISKNFTTGSFGQAQQGFDISGTTYLNMQNATMQPSSMVASSAIAEGQQAITSTQITALKAISSGTLNMDGTAVSNLDFSEIDASAGAFMAAAILSIHASSTLGQQVNFCVVDGKMNVQTLSGTQFGSKLDISPTTDTSKALFGDSATDVDTKSDFLESLDDALVAIEEKTSEFYGIGAQRTPNLSEAAINAEILQFAQSVQARTKMFFANLFDPTMYSASQDDIGSQLATKNLFRTVPCGLDALSDGDMASAAAGKLLPTLAGSSTLFGKTLATISGSNQGQGGQNLALEKNINVYSEIASISMFRNGTVCGTSPEYADIIRGIDWLTYEIQRNIFAMLTSKDKVEYTDSGVRILVQEVQRALDQGVQNGLIAGDVVDGKVVPAFEISAQRVADVPAAQRQGRVAPDITFNARLAGAIQAVNVIGTVSV